MPALIPGQQGDLLICPTIRWPGCVTARFHGRSWTRVPAWRRCFSPRDNQWEARRKRNAEEVQQYDFLKDLLEWTNISFHEANSDTETSSELLISQLILPQHNIIHCCLKKKSYVVIRRQPMGSKIAFWNCFVSFALGLPVCNQTTFSLHYLYYKRKPEHFWYQHLAPLPTNSNLMWLKHCFKHHEDRLINSGVNCF